MLSKGNIDGAIESLKEALMHERLDRRGSFHGVDGTSQEAGSPRSHHWKQPSEVIHILYSLCTCLVKKGDWPAVVEHCDIVLSGAESATFQKHITEEKWANLLMRRATAKAHVRKGGAALSRERLESMRRPPL